MTDQRRTHLGPLIDLLTRHHDRWAIACTGGTGDHDPVTYTAHRTLTEAEHLFGLSERIESTSPVDLDNRLRLQNALTTGINGLLSRRPTRPVDSTLTRAAAEDPWEADWNRWAAIAVAAAESLLTDPGCLHSQSSSSISGVGNSGPWSRTVNHHTAAVEIEADDITSPTPTEGPTATIAATDPTTVRIALDEPAYTCIECGEPMARPDDDPEQPLTATAPCTADTSHIPHTTPLAWLEGARTTLNPDDGTFGIEVTTRTGATVVMELRPDPDNPDNIILLPPDPRRAAHLATLTQRTGATDNTYNVGPA